MKIKKKAKSYLPLEDLKKINSDYLDELENVKKRLNFVRDKEISEAFQKVILSSYSGEIELRTCEREVDYEIRKAEIEERWRVLKPFRRGWWWRLLLRPLTNRAQDIIEERAQIDADIIHSAAEKQIDEDYKKLNQDDEQKPTKRDLRQKLKAAIEAADNADVRQAFDEPADVPATSESDEKQQVDSTTSENVAPPAEPAPVQAQQSSAPQGKGQLPGQLTLDDVQKLTPAQPARRPRPPRNCRKPPAQG